MRIITVIINIYGYSNTATESEAHLLFKWRQRFIVMLSSCSRINNLNNNHFCSCTYVFGLFAKMLIVPASWFPHHFLEESQHGDASINSRAFQEKYKVHKWPSILADSTFGWTTVPVSLLGSEALFYT